MKVQFKSENDFNKYTQAWYNNEEIVRFMPDGWSSIIVIDRIDIIADTPFWDIAVDPEDGRCLHTISEGEMHFFNVIEK
ncbi:hypothetical protein [Aeromonas phage vB_AsM_ZHF]|uniref:Uncharacterized protein n=1 Tax=Aeromonas phage vB_AsM_ZHF TaxID=2812849 RepID=A0A898KAB7_9CAUD|nr:hypothetical protein [Aeromonas phage vB_AsM_ZHF]